MVARLDGIEEAESSNLFRSTILRSANQSYAWQVKYYTHLTQVCIRQLAEKKLIHGKRSRTIRWVYTE